MATRYTKNAVSAGAFGMVTMMLLCRAMAQATLPKGQYSQFTLAIDAESGSSGVSLLQSFLKGQTKTVNLENSVLREITFAKSGRRKELVPDKARFTDYKKVDRLIAEVTLYLCSLALEKRICQTRLVWSWGK